MRILSRLFSGLILVTASALPAAAGELEPLLRTLQAVGPKGAGNRRATRAWEQLARADAGQLPVVLAGLDGAGPLGANWIRTAVDAISQRQLQQGGRLPAAELERFVLDRRHAPRARRLAYELLVRADPSTPRRLLAGMLDDPSLELRRDAVARRIEEAAALEKRQRARAVAAYQGALSAARDLDQIKLLAGRLRKLGLEVDLPRHFGFLVRWKVIGPFDNTDEKGFDHVYPPEGEIDLRAPCEGKHGKVKWIDYVTRNEYGKVDLNKGLAHEKDVAGYALAHFISQRQQRAEIRAASENAIKVWLNGRLISQRNVYHMGSQTDQFVSRVALKPGRNAILVKLCQDANPASWADSWGFQLRICDTNGTAILSTDREKEAAEQ